MKPLRIIFMSLLIFGWANLTYAADKPAPKETTAAPVKKAGTPTAKKTKKAAPKRFTGNIAALDAKAGVVSVKGTAQEKNFMTQDAAKDALERLAVGDRVRVQYTEKEGKATATSVRRLKMPQSKTKSSSPGAKAKPAAEKKESAEKKKPAA